MRWKDCGYLCVSKSGKKIVIVIKHIRYVATLEAFMKILDGKQNYTLIYEPPQKEVKKGLFDEMSKEEQLERMKLLRGD